MFIEIINNLTKAILFYLVTKLLINYKINFVYLIKKKNTALNDYYRSVYRVLKMYCIKSNYLNLVYIFSTYYYYY